MAKISALDPAQPLDGSENIPVVQGAATRRLTFSALCAGIAPLLQSWYKGDPGDPGPAGNVAATSAQLTAAATTNRSMLFRGRIFNWRTGDQARRVDAIDGFAADGIAPAQGAWLVREGQVPVLGLDADLVTIEDAYRGTVLVPREGAALPAGPLLNRYEGGPMTVGGEPRHLNGTSAGLHAATLDLGRLGNTGPAVPAIEDGFVHFVYVGDSIADGRSQIQGVDSWTVSIARAIEARAGGVQCRFTNLSIPGRGIGDLNAAGYVGTAGAPVAGASFAMAETLLPGLLDYRWWRGGTVPNKSWAHHVRDLGAHVLVIALGENDFGDPRGFAGSLRSFIANQVSTWPVAPAIWLVTPVLPNRRDPAYAAQQRNLRAVAGAVRSLARLFNVSLLDHQRWQEMLRDGLDTVHQAHARLSGFAGVGDWTLAAGVRPVLDGAALAFDQPGMVTRAGAVRDATIDLTAQLQAGGSAGVLLRASANAQAGYIVQAQASPPQVAIYYNDGVGPQRTVASAAIAAPENGYYGLRVVWEEGDYAIFANGVRILRDVDFDELRPGVIGLTGAAARMVSFSATLGYPRAVGRQEMDDALIFGRVDDSATNGWSPGGDTGHHPSICGHHQVLYGASRILLDWWAAAVRAPRRALHVSDFVTDTATDILPGDFFDVTINGSSASAGAVFGEDGGTVALTGERAITVTDPVVPVPVRFRRNGADFLTVPLRLPAKGLWAIRAAGHASEHAPGQDRHGLLVTAIRVQA